MRIIFNSRFRRGNANELEQMNHLRVCRRVGPVKLKRFLNLMADAEDGIQRRPRFLENVADHPAANAAHQHFQHVAALQQNLAAGITGRRAGHQTRNRKRGDGLA